MVVVAVEVVFGHIDINFGNGMAMLVMRVGSRGVGQCAARIHQIIFPDVPFCFHGFM